MQYRAGGSAGLFRMDMSLQSWSNGTAEVIGAWPRQLSGNCFVSRDRWLCSYLTTKLSKVVCFDLMTTKWMESEVALVSLVSDQLQLEAANQRNVHRSLRSLKALNGIRRSVGGLYCNPQPFEWHLLNEADQIAPTASNTALVTSISAGQFHTCALRSDLRVVCWGSNQYGQLGIGSTKDIGTDSSQLGSNLRPVNLGTGH